ncbi:quinol oxidase subunit 4 [Sphingobacterium alkalisoli]|nr:quinol oxidase subunit 4 [Sphingobacterium alkalisoli]
MRKILGFILVFAMLLSFSSCYTHRNARGHVPPGKAKKVYGDKSAKRYAPGQQKKKTKKGRGHHKYDVYLYRAL